MDRKAILNYGLGMLGSYTVTSLEPGVTPLEKRVASNYQQWKRSELTRRRWVFNRGFSVLTQEPTAPMATEERQYGYALPTDYLAAVRDKYSRWQIRGRYIYSAEDSLVLEYKMDVDEENFDPLFVDTLACRIALEMCEWVTQSNMKKADAERAYNNTIKLASANNALIIGPEDELTEPDENDSWIASRAGWGL